MNDFATTTTVSSNVDPATAGALGVFYIIYFIFVSIFALLAIIGLWKTFTKAGKPGWGSLIPFYNTYLIIVTAGKPGWWLLLLFVPFVNMIVGILVMLALAEAFGKSAVFAIFGLIIFSPIGFLMLGFGDAKYQLSGPVSPVGV